VTTLCFIDTETTSLRPDRRAWEIGLIVRRIAAPDHEQSWFIDTGDLDLGNADLMSLKIGRFHERHPAHSHGGGNPKQRHGREADVLAEVEHLTRGAHLAAAVVSFDAEVLAARMRAHGICPSWHYHLIDVEALAVGHLSAMAAVCERRAPSEIPGPERGAELRALASPPWKSDDLSAALGVTVSDEDRHTALGDARWAKAIYDAVIGEHHD
jgi:DNA polymerase III epsilon subunit-like protein